MTPRRSLDAGLLALLTVACSALCFGAVVLDLSATHELAAARTSTNTSSSAGTSTAAGATGTSR